MDWKFPLAPFPFEALARTSMDLGHGDGRGRWVKMIYLR